MLNKKITNTKERQDQTNIEKKRIRSYNYKPKRWYEFCELGIIAGENKKI